MMSKYKTIYKKYFVDILLACLLIAMITVFCYTIELFLHAQERRHTLEGDLNLYHHEQQACLSKKKEITHSLPYHIFLNRQLGKNITVQSIQKDIHRICAKHKKIRLEHIKFVSQKRLNTLWHLSEINYDVVLHAPDYKALLILIKKLIKQLPGIIHIPKFTIQAVPAAGTQKGTFSFTIIAPISEKIPIQKERN